MPVNSQAIKLIRPSMPMSRPVVVNHKPIWPWHLSRDERIAVKNATKGETLDTNLLAAILDERNLKANLKRGK